MILQQKFVSEDPNSTSDLRWHFESKANGSRITLQSSLFYAGKPFLVLKNRGLFLERAFLL